MMNNIRKRR